MKGMMWDIMWHFWFKAMEVEGMIPCLGPKNGFWMTEPRPVHARSLTRLANTLFNTAREHAL